MQLLETLTIPAVGWMIQLEQQKDLNTVKRVIGNCSVIREMIANGYKHIKDEKPIQSAPFESKKKLWGESKIYCEHDRMEWCEAVWFYECAK